MLRLFDRGLMVVSWVAAALVVVLLFAGPSLVGAKKATAPTTSRGSGATKSTAPTTRRGSGAASSRQVSGAAVFASAGCTGCHTLKAAQATGSVGPDLDQLRPSATDVSQIVRSGGGGMPSFSGKLSDAEIAAVASYVSTVAGR